jgi:outer membrane protein assembly factor BamA
LAVCPLVLAGRGYPSQAHESINSTLSPAHCFGPGGHGFRRNNAAWAVDPFTVRDIRVEGLQRVEPGTVFASLPVRVGDTYNDDKGSAAIRALFALGLFKDVRLEVNNDVLVVIVEERPTVADVEFAGAKEFDKDVLQVLRDIGLDRRPPFDQALADRAEQELKRQYINRSLYGAEVVTTVTPIERNRVNLTFSVTEGEPRASRKSTSSATRRSLNPRSRACLTSTPAAG